ncbi:unnamed protein product, partial [Rangifer tarandus platyrhynchus]
SAKSFHVHPSSSPPWASGRSRERLCRRLSPGRGLPRPRGAGGQSRAPRFGASRAARWCQRPDVRLLKLSAVLF